MATMFPVLILLVVLAGVVLLWFNSRSKKGDVRANGAKIANLPPVREATFSTLQPGDAIIFWDETDALVQTVLECAEHLGSRETRWRWLFLDDGRMIETSSLSRVLYSPVSVFFQGTAPFADLTADADQGGALKSFEERVRAGTVARDPVHFIYDGERYRTKSTGVFIATIKGTALPPGPWADISPEEGDNVYFKMGFGDDGEALGIWTTHVAFLAGKPLADSDIKGLFAK